MIELYELQRKMIYAKANNEKFKYWWYKRKYNKLKKELEVNFFTKNKF